MLPQPIEGASNPAIESAVATMQRVIEGGRKVREQQKKSMKQPLKEVVIVAETAVLAEAEMLESYILSELNVGACRREEDDGTWVVNTLVPNFKLLGKKLGKDMPKVKTAIMSMAPDKVEEFIASGTMEVEGYTLTSGAMHSRIHPSLTRLLKCPVCAAEEVQVTKKFKGESETMKGTMAEGGILVLLNTELDDVLVAKGYVREFVNRVQKLRKSGGLAATDKIEVFYEPLSAPKKAPKKGKKGKGAAAAAPPTVADTVAKLGGEIGSVLNTPAPTLVAALQPQTVVLAEEEVEIDDEKFGLKLARVGLGFSTSVRPIHTVARPPSACRTSLLSDTPGCVGGGGGGGWGQGARDGRGADALHHGLRAAKEGVRGQSLDPRDPRRAGGGAA